MSLVFKRPSAQIMIGLTCSLLLLGLHRASAAEHAETTALPNESLSQPVVDNLAATMRIMNNDLKLISAQAADSTKNASSMNLARDFTAAVSRAKTFVPDSISSLPPDQQLARLALYKKMLDSVNASGEQLGLAFKNNQNAQAVTILKTLAQMKADGHAEFN